MRSGATLWRQSPAWRPLAAAAAVGVVLFATAAPGQTARRPPAAQSQPAEADVHALARAMEMQLRLVHRHNVPEYTHRSEQLRSAIAAWQSSSRTAADQREIAAWLRQSIRDSMPGARHALPPLPMFAAAPRPAEPRAADTSSPSVARSQPNALPRAPAPPSAQQSQPAGRQTAKPVNRPADAAKSLDRQNIWDRHPAADQWPLDLSEGDPFVDDPLPE